MTNDNAELLAIGREAVNEARLVLEETPINAVRSKHDRDLVSNVDVSIERRVRDYLAERTPHVGFVGEEGGTEGDTADLTWILDPIDGTSNFLHGIPLYGISLALVSDKAPLVGVIALPSLGNEYYAAAGHGAFKDRTAIHCRKTTELGKAIVSIGDYAVGDAATERNEKRLALTAQLASEVERVRMLGSAAVDMAWLAEGRTNAALALSNSAWDFTAGVAIAREAGARVRDIDGSEHSLDSHGIVATSPGLSDETIALVQRAIGQRRQT